MTDLLQKVSELSPEKRRLLLSKLAERRAEPGGLTIPRLERTGAGFELSYSQQRFWFLDQLDPGSPAYNIATPLRLFGRLDETALTGSIAGILGRHESLRTIFVSADGVGFQRILAPGGVALPVIDLGTLPATRRQATALDLARREARRPFDLARGPLLRCRLLRLAEEDHVALFTLHHIISDGWSSGVLVRELSASYESLAAGRPPHLPELPVQYADFAVWQRRWLTGEVLQSHLAYWTGRLAGGPPLLELPTDRPRPKAWTHRGSSVPFSLSAARVRSLRRMAQQSQATLFMTLLSWFGALMSRLSRQADVFIGSPIANRSAETENLIGSFINTLVLRVSLLGDPDAATLLRRVRETTLGAYAHQSLPFERLVDEMHPERALGHSPLFQAMLTFQNTPREKLELEGLEIAPFPIPAEVARLDLDLVVAEHLEGLEGRLVYSVELFDRATMLRLLGHFESLLEDVTAHPERRLSQAHLLRESELHQLTREWNDTASIRETPRDLPELFALQAALSPQAVAVVAGSEHLSYGELDRQAARISGLLRDSGAGPAGAPVGVFLERSRPLVEALLGILQAGSSYLPLDPIHPDERLAFMLADAGVSVILTQRSLRKRLPMGRAKVLLLDEVTPRLEVPRHPLRAARPAESLAYVLYTSGSTGRPKGVMVPHAGLTHYLTWAARAYGAAAARGSVVHTSVGFDLSVTSLFLPLIVGGTVELPPDEDGFEALARTLARGTRSSLLKVTPAHLEVLSRLLPHSAAASFVRTLVVGGEALLEQSLAYAREVAPEASIVNEYGPTEATVGCSAHEVVKGRELKGSVPIGRPIGNTRLYLLDRCLTPVPPGVTGELYISGHGLARGYLGQPAKTARLFVPDPFAGGVRTGGRLYRTGDLVRFLQAGELEFLGRTDCQVKLRGYRIELGEVEAVLTRHPDVGQAVVTVTQQGPELARLVAHVVPSSGAVTTVSASGSPRAKRLREFLEEELPDYMVPAAFVWLDGLPLDVNGKVDRKALPTPLPGRGDRETAPEPPRTAAERTLAGIWREVLGVDRVGIRDNFFELGGDSITSIRIVARARQAGLAVTVKQLFEKQTVAELAELVTPCEAPGAHGELPLVDRATFDRLVARDWEVEDAYPLSPTQAGMLFHHIYAPEARAYFEQSSWTFRGPLDSAALHRAWERLIERHPVLRTYFLWEGLDEPLQVVRRRIDLPWQELDWRALAPEAQRKRLREHLASDWQRGLDLSAPPLVRLTLVRLADEVHQLVWSWHHTLIDGWSMSLLTAEGLAIYDGSRQGLETELKPAPPYRSYISWLKRQDLAAAESFWRRTLEGYTAPIQLSIHRAPGKLSDETNRYAGRRVRLGPDLEGALGRLARQHQVTLNTLFQGVWSLMLGTYSQSDDVVFGITSSGRPGELPEVESTIGMFLMTLPMRVRITPEERFADWLRELQAQQIGLRQYEFTSLVQIRQWSQVPADQPLLEIFLLYQNTPDVSADEWQGRELLVEGVGGYNRAVDPFLLVVTPGRELVLQVSYDTERFDGLGVQRMLRQLRVALEAVAVDPQRRISTLPLLSEPEAHQAIYEWNDTRGTGAEPGCVHRVFEAHAARTPHAVALSSVGYRWSYGELDRRANRSARFLIRAGAGPERLTALLVERGPDYLITVLALFKAGGAYVPLDPRQPAARARQILSQSGAQILVVSAVYEDLASGWLAPHTAPARPRVVGIGELGGAGEPQEGLPCRCRPETLAYLICTSGSTGTPKGAMLHVRGMMNHLWDKVARFGLGAGDTVSQPSPLTFDISVWQYMGILLAGGRVHVIPEEVAHDPVRLMREVENERISILETGPSLLGVLLEEVGRLGQARPRPDVLRWVLVSGEALAPELCRRWRELYPRVPLLNAYGPTECSDDVTHHPLQGALSAETLRVPLGFPIPDSAFYVLDRHLRPVPRGVPAEICLGGVCVGRGYRNDPARTALSFVPDPFTVGAGHRLYRSGDLACRRHDGNPEFLGRIDFQVKIRGFRIELGEIESVLDKHSSLQQAVVMAQEVRSGETALVAYVVFESGREVPVDELRAHLENELPDHMVPSSFVVLEALPLDPNGKVNRPALALLEPAPFDRQREIVAPRSPIEEMLAQIWQEVLGVGQLGVHDDFFALGGHSLLAIRTVSRVREAFGVDLPLRELFESPTLAGLGGSVESRLRAGTRRRPPSIEPVERNRPLPLSFPQKRLWFIDQLEPGIPIFNHLLVAPLPPEPDLAALELGVSEVIRRHEILRTVFHAPGGEPRQVILPPAPVRIPVVDLAALPEAARLSEGQRLVRGLQSHRFDLEKGPLVRYGLLRGVEGTSVLGVVLHHIVTDAWSDGILTRELVTLYGAASGGEPASLPELPIQYADYSVWQQEWLRGEVLEDLVGYWRRQLDGAPPLLALPTDRPRPAVQTPRGALLRVRVPHALAAGLRDLGKARRATHFMTLLAVFKALLFRWSAEPDLSVGTYVANRNQAATENLVGFFVNTLVLRSRLAGDPSFVELLEQIRETTLGAYAHQDLPFEKLLDVLHVERNLSHTPLFQVMLQHLPVAAGDDDGTMSQVSRAVQLTRVEFTLTLSVEDEGTRLSLSYNRDLFDGTTMVRVADQLRALFSAVVAEPRRRLGELPMLTRAQQHQALTEWSSAPGTVSAIAPVHVRFAAWAAKTPTATAVVWGSQELTYGELERRAGRLARHLRALGVGPESCVGLYGERAPELMVGLLGILKAGGAYLPLDPAWPDARLDFMVEDSRLEVLVAHKPWHDVVPANGRRRPRVVRPDEDLPPAEEELPDSSSSPDHLAYVIYTSGSTGRPKGVEITHASLARYTDTACDTFAIEPGDRVLQFASISFDTAAEEIFPCLARGATLILRTDEMIGSPAAFLERCAATGVTVLDLPTAYWAEIVAALEAGEAILPDSLRLVIIGGEKASADTLALWRKNAGSRPRLINTYGPTETTIVATRCELTPAGERGVASDVPLGFPLRGVRTYVANLRQRPVGIGVAGELLIGGGGLARGYLGRRALTAERFCPNPFGAAPGERLYRTGDLVRHGADGRLFFLGRIDQQVKVRGFRVEMGEIEEVLRRHPAIREAAVDLHAGAGGARLVAYAATALEQPPDAGELRLFLKRQVPEYMLPSHFVFLASLPLTPSGKLDRRALPSPDGPAGSEREFVAPETEIEMLLTEIWSEVLGVAAIGARDNFFELGGHSLLATQVLARLRSRLGIDLPLLALFELPTVEELALAVEEAVLNKLEAPDAGNAMAEQPAWS